ACRHCFGCLKNQDRLGFSFRCRGCSVELVEDWSFSDAGFRFAVRSIGMTHFIFLDEALIDWLQGVLQVALMQGWKFSGKDVRRSGSRVIHVGGVLK
ncbi:unnamed protein product, partial [Linum tenue]